MRPVGGLSRALPAVVGALALTAAVSACTSAPVRPTSLTPQADADRLSLVNGAIDSGPKAGAAGFGNEGGGAAIVRAGQPSADIRTPDVPPGHFTITALCLGHGSVRITVRPRTPPGYPLALPAVSAPVTCGFSEDHGRDVLSGDLATVGVDVTLQAADGADGAVAFRIRGR